MATEHPVFIPFGTEQLAAVVTVPESRPRALVLLLQGLGPPRSHYYQLWSVAARSLAQLGLASVRMDYQGIGDSTGAFPSGDASRNVAEIEVVTGTVLDVLGLDRLGVVGNCFGMHLGLLMVARMKSFASAAIIVAHSPKQLLEGGGKSAPHRAAKQAARHLPTLARKIRGVLRTESIEPRMRFQQSIRSAVGRADLLFLFVGREALARRLEQGVAQLGKTMGAEHRHRAEVRLIPATNASGLRLPLGTQQPVIDGVVAWMDETLPAAGPGQPVAVAAPGPAVPHADVQRAGARGPRGDVNGLGYGKD